MNLKNILQKKITLSDWIVIIANFIPVYGVWFLEWSATDVFIVYVLETLLIGVITVLKLATSAFTKSSYNNESRKVGGLFFIVFFVFHYGFFAFVQTTIFSQVAGIVPPGKSFTFFFFNWHQYLNKDMVYMMIGFGVSHLINDFIPFIQKKEYQSKSMMQVMISPYGRIFVQQITVIVGSFFLLLKQAKIFILIFACIKILFDLFIDFSERLNKQMKENG